MLASVQMRRLAEDDLVQLLCSYLSVVDSSLNRYGTKVVRGDVASAPLNEPTGVWAAEARRRTALQMGRGSLAQLNSGSQPLWRCRHWRTRRDRSLLCQPRAPAKRGSGPLSCFPAVALALTSREPQGRLTWARLGRSAPFIDIHMPPRRLWHRRHLPAWAWCSGTSGQARSTR